jgi:hypothetical protein
VAGHYTSLNALTSAAKARIVKLARCVMIKPAAAALDAAAVERAAARERLNEHSVLLKLTADAVSARENAAEAFSAESGVWCQNAAPFMGGWSFFAHCGTCGDQGAAVIAAIRRLGFAPSRHEVNDRHDLGSTFYAKLAVVGGAK